MRGILYFCSGLGASSPEMVNAPPTLSATSPSRCTRSPSKKIYQRDLFHFHLQLLLNLCEESSITITTSSSPSPSPQSPSPWSPSPVHQHDHHHTFTKKLTLTSSSTFVRSPSGVAPRPACLGKDLFTSAKFCQAWHRPLWGSFKTGIGNRNLAFQREKATFTFTFNEFCSIYIYIYI